MNLALSLCPQDESCPPGQRERRSPGSVRTVDVTARAFTSKHSFEGSLSEDVYNEHSRWPKTGSDAISGHLWLCAGTTPGPVVALNLDYIETSWSTTSTTLLPQRCSSVRGTSLPTTLKRCRQSLGTSVTWKVAAAVISKFTAADTEKVAAADTEKVAAAVTGNFDAAVSVCRHVKIAQSRSVVVAVTQVALTSPPTLQVGASSVSAVVVRLNLRPSPTTTRWY
ncbi:hypothetical protein LSAT2_024302 [Lamellibrachia satsuma]|nr:hypothetical protein LSAT2_024302 [Lamellibrachia satsuma]